MKKIFISILLICLFLFVFAETNYLRNKNLFISDSSIWPWVLASLAVTLFVFFFPGKAKEPSFSKASVILKIFLIFGTLFIIFLEAAIVDFSGILFGPEVIFHFNWDAFVLGVKEYRFQLILLILMIAFFVYCVVKTTYFINHKFSLIGFVVSLCLIIPLFEFTIYGRYYDGFNKYQNLKAVKQVAESEVKELDFLGINILTVEKQDIEVTKKGNKNLITIYLESFSDIFVNNPNYPNLTPNLEKLSKRFHKISPYISTGHFTMDGLISSHCGFIPNMIMGNNTMATGDKFYYNVPCFTDVLKKAGYHQEFLGGAKKSFAGKGDFLLDHGYDKVWGREDFEETHEQDMTWWGLHDDELFSQAQNLLLTLQNKNQPFHLGILTLGTHLKGYPAPSCPTYKNSDDKFIQAIHCTDFLIGSLINFLEQNAFLDNTHVIITGDHTVFNTSYTQNLFGSGVGNKNLFGLIVSKEKVNQKAPMGLYDIAPTALEMLAIKHNTSFILGDAFGGDSSRKIFTRNELFISGKESKLDSNCDFDLNKKIVKKSHVDLCDHRAIINKLYGYTENFKIQTGIKLGLNSEIKIYYQNQFLKVASLTLNNKEIKQNFRKNGFIIDPESFFRKGVFVVKINHESNNAEQFLFFDEIQSMESYFENQSGVPKTSLVFFGVNLDESTAMIATMVENLGDTNCSGKLACVYTTTESIDVFLELTDNVITIRFSNKNT
jgi:phosphoglycerol transferase MdoB-like AlkP superfamily enzyme